MRLLLVSDAWRPQVNGVVRTLESVVGELEAAGHEVRPITPDGFRTLPCPTYPEIRLALLPRRRLAEIAGQFQPQALHVATEGPLGLAARALCQSRAWSFTTSFHTRFPEYVRARTGAPLAWGWRYLRWFHGPARRVLAATPALCAELAEHGLVNAALWSRGVDTARFRPRPKGRLLPFPRPIALYVGRVSVEKNIEAFLELDLPGSKVVLGDGPARARLERRFPEARFLGAKHGEDLACHFAEGDVLVFPSRTDTYGLVMLEALACGLPVAAFPVGGPRDVLTDPSVGAMDDDLESAVLRALTLRPEDCRRFAEQRSWSACARLFVSHLEPLVPGLGAA